MEALIEDLGARQCRQTQTLRDGLAVGVEIRASAAGARAVTSRESGSFIEKEQAGVANVGAFNRKVVERAG